MDGLLGRGSWINFGGEEGWMVWGIGIWDGNEDSFDGELLRLRKRALFGRVAHSRFYSLYCNSFYLF